MNYRVSKRAKVLVSLAALLVAGNAGAVFFLTSLGEPFDPADYAGETCFPETIDVNEPPGSDVLELRINPAGVLNDGDENTFLVCHIIGDQVECLAGTPDGNRWGCQDTHVAAVFPDLGDRVTFLYDTVGGETACFLTIERAFGEDNPACRGSSSTGGSSGTGGSSSTGANFECSDQACTQATPYTAWDSTATLGTTGDAWYVISGSDVAGKTLHYQTSEFQGRSVVVNGVLVPYKSDDSQGNLVVNLTPANDGNYYFHFTGPGETWASWTAWVTTP